MQDYIKILNEYLNDGINRTFDNRDDMMDLYQAIEKAGKWDDFDNYSWNYRKGVKPEISHTTWLFCLDGKDYEPRCKLVSEFYGWEGKCL